MSGNDRAINKRATVKEGPCEAAGGVRRAYPDEQASERKEIALRTNHIDFVLMQRMRRVHEQTHIANSGGYDPKVGQMNEVTPCDANRQGTQTCFCSDKHAAQEGIGAQESRDASTDVSVGRGQGQQTPTHSP